MHSSLHSVVQPAVRIIPAAQKTASTDAAFRRGAMESNKSPPPFPSPPAASDNPSASSRSLWEDRPANKQPGRNSGSQLTFLMPHHGGNLFSWGLPEARIARKGGDNSIPELALPNLKVISIAASRHSAIATSQGHVWTMGHNDSAGGGGHGSKPLSASGQLGRGGTKEPGRVLGEIENEHIVQVATGRYHTVALSDKGVVYSWGLNDQGQLGRAGVGASNAQDPTSCFSGESCHDGQPKKVDQLQGIHIIGLSCSRYNTMALDDQGNLHVFGFDGCADGTLPAKNEAWRARLVKGGLENEKVTAFDAGYTFWIAATRSGSVFTCNHQDDGYAGTLKNKRKPNDAGELGREAFVDKSGFSPYLPERVKGELEGKHIVAVAAGREHALAVDSEGRVFGWGGREDVTGRVRQALGPSLREPGQLEGDLKGDKILFVAAGEVRGSVAPTFHPFLSPSLSLIMIPCAVLLSGSLCQSSLRLGR